ncbi:carboxymuconolactone decarboxylase family protein [Micromonospora sp. CPCC 206061]|uniref:carboxymuconolactone decarboxylase family protein n=1 Tax=Micromonospora sp. CPCC 206061 TaxID=3122410 RepID=UPI002FEEDCAA
MAARIVPHEEPYHPRVKALLASMVPPDLPPLRVMRTLARNGPMARAMTDWIGYELSDAISVDLRARELIITRTCARCGCEYQWGLHIAVWAERAELTAGQIRSIAHGSGADPCWTDRRDRLLLDFVDQLHQRSDVDDVLWAALSEYFTEEQLLDLLALCGWYHTVSFLVRAARIEREPGIPGFADVRG